MSVHTALLSVEEFLKLPEPQEGHIELHHGEVIVMPPPKRGHQRIQDRIMMLLKRLVGDTGVVQMEMAFRPTPEHEVWQADVACVSVERDAATDDDEYLMGSPELVIEVLSPSNTMDEILERQDICLANGCVSFWTVDPKRQIVMVTTPDRRTVVFDRQSLVPLPEPLEGSIEIAKVFSD
ncbi:MAG: Uma2 family endonuclease [Bryobacteraceae bacterium]|jgi:Uma2 family endonuclease